MRIGCHGELEPLSSLHGKRGLRMGGQLLSAGPDPNGPRLSFWESVMTGMIQGSKKVPGPGAGMGTEMGRRKWPI